MLAYRLETTIEQDGLLNLDQLPLKKGERVEVIILRQEPDAPLAVQPCFLPFKAIHLQGEGPTAAQMVIQDRS